MQTNCKVQWVTNHADLTQTPPKTPPGFPRLPENGLISFYFLTLMRTCSFQHLGQLNHQRWRFCRVSAPWTAIMTEYSFFSRLVGKYLTKQNLYNKDNLFKEKNAKKKCCNNNNLTITSTSLQVQLFLNNCFLLFSQRVSARTSGRDSLCLQGSIKGLTHKCHEQFSAGLLCYHHHHHLLNLLKATVSMCRLDKQEAVF